jgi:Transposase DDE domain
MIIPKNRLSGEIVRQAVEALLSEAFGWTAKGSKCDSRLALNVLVSAAVTGRTIESVCNDLTVPVTSNTIRGYLNQQLTVDRLEAQAQQVNEALVNALPAGLRRDGCEMAIDYHDEPFYGKRPEVTAYMCGSQAKAGTTHFYRIASLYVMWRQVRVTLAVVYVQPHLTTLVVIQKLVERMTALGFRPKVLYMDKGFCCGEVIRYLQQTHLPTLLACPVRGKAGGIRRLCQGRRAYLTEYTFTDGTTARLALVPRRVPDQTGKRRTKWLVFVLINLNWSAKKACQRYRRRFGIESAFRQLRQIRARTAGLNPALRFCLLGLPLILLNVWVFFRLAATRVIATGPTHWFPTLFQLPRFIAFLRRAIEQRYGTRDEIAVFTF